MIKAAYLAALIFAAPLVAQPTERHALRGDRVVIYDLIGDVRVVEGGSGRDVVVEVTRQGSDAGQLRVETGDIGGVPTLRVIFPFDRISYETESGHHNISNLRVREDGTFGHGVGGRRVTISSRSGAEAAADLVVRVPSGTKLDLKLAAGSVTVEGTRSALDIDVVSADVELEGTRGDVIVETASGSIEARDSEGNLDVDTGSGSVRLTNVRAPNLRVDTGSGGVTCDGVTSDEITIDTGSGGVEIARAAARTVRVDVGSGSVDVALSRDAKDVYIDTGSGGVTLRVPESIGADVDLDTGSGGIESELPISITRRSRGALKGRIGNGEAHISVSTGSGGIRIRRAS
ncbi:MAG: DUF4097 family beta strand repeat-containing protein [Gemmatimonadaceae bacterium]